MKYTKWKFNKIETAIIGVIGAGLFGVIAYGLHFGYQKFWVNRDIICFVKEDVTAHKLFEEIKDKWLDELKLANSTPRMSLPTRIAVLQEIRRELTDQQWPDCATKAKENLTKSMDSMIDGFIAFLSDESDILVSLHVEKGERHLEIFTLYMEALKPENTKLRKKIKEELKDKEELDLDALEKIIKDMDSTTDE
jgi:hypothetical protein